MKTTPTKAEQVRALPTAQEVRQAIKLAAEVPRLLDRLNALEQRLQALENAPRGLSGLFK